MNIRRHPDPANIDLGATASDAVLGSPEVQRAPQVGREPIDQMVNESLDRIFGNRANRPPRPTDAPRPIDAYGSEIVPGNVVIVRSFDKANADNGTLGRVSIMHVTGTRWMWECNHKKGDEHREGWSPACIGVPLAELRPINVGNRYIAVPLANTNQPQEVVFSVPTDELRADGASTFVVMS